MNKLHIGTRVSHKVFGLGVITQIHDRGFADVRFDETSQTKPIMLSFLEPIIETATVIKKNDVSESPDDSGIMDKTFFHFYPKDYQSSEFFTDSEKSVFNSLKEKMRRGRAAYGTTPLNADYDNRIGFILNHNRGLVIFKIWPYPVSNIDESSMSTLESIRKAAEENIHRKLLLSKWLIETTESEKRLKFPFKTIMVIPDLPMKYEDPSMRACSEKYPFIHFRNWLNAKCDSVQSLFSTFSINADALHVDIGFNEYLSIFERILPEYTTLLLQKPDVQVPTITIATGPLQPITGNEIEYSTLVLDDNQISFVNDLKEGSRLILASPGTGKTVLLLAKAYRLSNHFMKSNVLITCYNRNLHQKYVHSSIVNGFSEARNLRIYTFYSLASKMLRDAGVDAPTINGNNDDDYHALVDLFEKSVLDGTIKIRFKAVLIDEVQLFESRWIDLCYMLLESPADKAYFEAYGDLNQDVRALKRRGAASWQNITSFSFSERTTTLRKNYRNTKQISSYIGKVMETFSRELAKFGYSANEKDYLVTSIASRNGVMPVVMQSSRADIIDKVMGAIEELHTRYALLFEEICIAFPYQQYKPKSYYPLLNLKNALNAEKIPYTEIFGENAKSLTTTDGVVLTTIDSFVGLDFKAVIIFGLLPLAYYFLGDKCIPIKGIENMTDPAEQEECINQYRLNSRKYYAACSRARDYLYVVNDIPNTLPLFGVVNFQQKDGEYFVSER